MRSDRKLVISSSSSSVRSPGLRKWNDKSSISTKTPLFCALPVSVHRSTFDMDPLITLLHKSSSADNGLAISCKSKSDVFAFHYSLKGIKNQIESDVCPLLFCFHFRLVRLDHIGPSTLNQRESNIASKLVMIPFRSSDGKLEINIRHSFSLGGNRPDALPDLSLSYDVTFL